MREERHDGELCNGRVRQTDINRAPLDRHRRLNVNRADYGITAVITMNERVAGIDERRIRAASVSAVVNGSNPRTIVRN